MTTSKAPPVCPHCGAHIQNQNALSCPHCGADESTAWGYAAEYSVGDIPTGWSENDDFSYDDFLLKEFGTPPPFSWKQWGKKAGVVIILVCIARYLLF